MSTFSCLLVPEGHKEEITMVSADSLKFNYPEIVSDHNRYRGGGVDNQNAFLSKTITTSAHLASGNASMGALAKLWTYPSVKNCSK